MIFESGLFFCAPPYISFQLKPNDSEKLASSPVDSDGDEREDASGHRAGRDELRELAVDAAERPVVVQQEDEIEHGVEDGDERVGDGQVHQEVVGDGSHALVAEHDPDDDEVSAGGDRHHRHKNRDERHLASHAPAFQLISK